MIVIGLSSTLDLFVGTSTRHSIVTKCASVGIHAINTLQKAVVVEKDGRVPVSYFVG